MVIKSTDQCAHNTTLNLYHFVLCHSFSPMKCETCLSTICIATFCTNRTRSTNLVKGAQPNPLKIYIVFPISTSRSLIDSGTFCNGNCSTNWNEWDRHS